MNNSQIMFLFVLFGYLTIGALVVSIFDTRFTIIAGIMSLVCFAVIWKILGTNNEEK